MSEDQTKFLRWLVANCVHLSGSLDDLAKELWHRHKRAIQRQGISLEQVEQYIREHYRGA